MADTSYNKLLDPVSDIITAMESIMSDALGATSGDQRESLKRIHANTWGLHTLIMDIITSLGMDDIATRPEIYDRFQALTRPIHSNIDDLTSGYDGSLSEEQDVMMGFVADEVDSVEHMMDNLWHYSMLKHDKIEPIMSKIDISVLTQKITSVLKNHNVPKMIFPVQISGDASYLPYAFGEIAYNIKHHANVTGISLEAQLYANRVDITIYDEGEGFTCENMTKPFQPFWQSDENNNGLGLGLYLAKTFIEQSRGTISISSAHEKGTLIKISLPLAS
jgi:K+-sensing histidine kinase KdpD